MSNANTIYEYYDVISDRYHLARVFDLGGKTRIKHLWQPLAVPVRIPGYEDFDLFIYKEGSAFILCEALTGSEVINQRHLGTREQRRMNKGRFIAMLPALLGSRGGPGEINKQIVNFLCDYDQLISPRYKVKEV